MRRRRKDKLDDRRISLAYQATCHGIQIDMLDVPKVFRVGREAIAEGADDVVLASRIREFVETIRHNGD